MPRELPARLLKQRLRCDCRGHLRFEQHEVRQTAPGIEVRVTLRPRDFSHEKLHLALKLIATTGEFLGFLRVRARIPR